MNKKIYLMIMWILVLALFLPASPASAAYANSSLYYGDVTLSGGVENGHFPNLWDISAIDCNLTLTADVDLSGVVDAVNAYAAVQLGIRTIGFADFSPAGTGLWVNIRQAGGIHTLSLTLNATGSSVASLDGSPIPVYGSDNLSSDLTRMQVFFGIDGYGATHVVKFTDITASGCLVLETGTVNGAGKFFAEATGGPGNVTPGGEGQFTFLAKRRDTSNIGHIKFIYELDDLRLESSSYDWVSVSNTQGDFGGVGTLNGAPGFKFRVRAVDGDQLGSETDRFEIRIWRPDMSFESPTYRAEGYLANGQIIVHKR